MPLRSPLAPVPLLLCAALLPPAASAAPTDPVAVTRPDDALGDAFVPGLRTLADLPEAYVEEEFLVSGAADLFSYASDPPAGPTDTVVVESGVPWTTRLMVRRPEKPQHFNGTVVLEWWNSTAGFDSAPVWDVSAEYFAREGYVYVGVTNANQALSFLTSGCSLFDLLPPTCGTRYAPLSLPDDGVAYEMMSQIANLLKSDDAQNPIPSDYRVRRLYQTGQSQQGGSLVTYASAFHLPGVNDGYFVQANVFARDINGGPDCGAGAPAFPACTPQLEGDDRFVRTDLPVPVVQALGETDVAVLFGTPGRQPDAENFRYYELAGVAHLTIHEDVLIIPGPNPLFLEDLCENDLNTSADGPVVGSYLYNAMWRNLEDQVQWGRPPPPGVLLEVEGGVVKRDAFGNALGGVRVPEMDVPTGSHMPPFNQADPNLPPFLQFIGNLACFLGGSTTPFDPETLDALYPTHGAYVSQVVQATSDLSRAGFLVKEDAQLIRTQAAFSAIGRVHCGLGLELALMLPVLLRLRGARRRRG